MKYLDSIEIISDKYKEYGINKGTKGAIIMAPIRAQSFECELFGVDSNCEIFSIRIEDMKVIKSSNVTDKEILEDLPKHDPNWWCKVKAGYILNLKGEKKNKIAYDYDS